MKRYESKPSIKTVISKITGLVMSIEVLGLYDNLNQVYVSPKLWYSLVSANSTRLVLNVDLERFAELLNNKEIIL